LATEFDDKNSYLFIVFTFFFGHIFAK